MMEPAVQLNTRNVDFIKKRQLVFMERHQVRMLSVIQKGSTLHYSGIVQTLPMTGFLV